MARVRRGALHAGTRNFYRAVCRFIEQPFRQFVDDGRAMLGDECRAVRMITFGEEKRGQEETEIGRLERFVHAVHFAPDAHPPPDLAGALEIEPVKFQRPAALLGREQVDFVIVPDVVEHEVLPHVKMPARGVDERAMRGRRAAALARRGELKISRRVTAQRALAPAEWITGLWVNLGGG